MELCIFKKLISFAEMRYLRCIHYYIFRVISGELFKNSPYFTEYFIIIIMNQKWKIILFYKKRDLTDFYKFFIHFVWTANQQAFKLQKPARVCSVGECWPPTLRLFRNLGLDSVFHRVSKFSQYKGILSAMMGDTCTRYIHSPSFNTLETKKIYF